MLKHVVLVTAPLTVRHVMRHGLESASNMSDQHLDRQPRPSLLNQHTDLLSVLTKENTTDEE